MPINSFKTSLINVEYETKAKNLLNSELKRKGVTYAQLAEKLGAMGIQETERNLNNKISHGGFTGAFLTAMLRGNWRKDLEFGLIVAVCALLIILPISGLLLSEYAEIHRANATYQENAERDRDAASKEISESCFKTDFAIFSKCVTEKIATYYDQQATNEDLQAQQDMAYWAKTLFTLGIFQLVFSGAGIYFIWHSLRLNRDAVNAAIESNKVAREIGEAQVRAYLTCTGGEYNIDDKWVFARPFLVNKGQSPAKSIKIIAYLTVHHFRISDDGKITTDVKARTEIFEGSCQAISSQSQETGILIYNHVEIGKEAFDILRAGTMAFNIDGQAIWLDVFDREQRIFFSLRSKLDDVSKLGFSKDRAGTFEVYNKDSDNR